LGTPGLCYSIVLDSFLSELKGKEMQDLEKILDLDQSEKTEGIEFIFKSKR